MPTRTQLFAQRKPPPNLLGRSQPTLNLAPRKPQPPAQHALPPLSPRGFAVDLTPTPHRAVASNEPLHPTARVSQQARGAAMLSRGSFQTFLQQHDNKLNPSEKKAVKMLGENRHQLLEPKNQQYLSLLQRTQPGSDLHNRIYATPHTAEQHTLLKAGLNVSWDARQSLRQHGLTDDQIDRTAAQQMSGDQAAAAAHGQRIAQAQQRVQQLGQQGKAASIDPVTGAAVLAQPGGWFGRLTGGAMDAVIGSAPGLYYLGTHDPRKTIPQLAGATYHSFAGTVTHPIRQLQQDPFTFFSNVGTVAGAGIGVAGRAAGVSDALSAARAAGMQVPEHLNPGASLEDLSAMQDAHQATVDFMNPPPGAVRPEDIPSSPNLAVARRHGVNTQAARDRELQAAYQNLYDEHTAKYGYTPEGPQRQISYYYSRMANRTGDDIQAEQVARANLAAVNKRIESVKKTGFDPGHEMRVFHGTGKAFKDFDFTQAKEHGLYGPGAYFTDDPKIASTYAKESSVPTEQLGKMEQHGFKTKEEAQQFYDANYEHSTGPHHQLGLNRWVVNRYEKPIPQNAPNVRIHTISPRKILDVNSRVPQELLGPAREFMKKNATDARVSIGPEGIDKYFDSGNIHTGHDLYNLISSVNGHNAAHDFLKSQGYDGIRYNGGVITGGARHNAYVMFNKDAIHPRIPDFEKLPTQEEAVTGGQGRAYGGLARLGPTPMAQAAIHGFTHPKFRNVLDLYTQGRFGTHQQAINAMREQNIMEDIQKVNERPIPAQAPAYDPRNLGLTAGRFKGTYQDIRHNIRQTRINDRQKVQDIMNNQHAPVGKMAARGAAITAGTWREALDGIRAGTIYLRSAYLPNNWAGNAFMNATHQGFLAPKNLAMSAILHRHLNPNELATLRVAHGTSPMQQLGESAQGMGYVRSLTDPLAKQMGRAADQPFRDAAILHELRRDGFYSIDQVKALTQEAGKGNQEAQAIIARAGRKSQDEIVRFDKFGPEEKALARNLLFVWNWTKGATRYAARYPLAHPVQSGILNQASKIGNQYVQSKVGGLPPYLVGSIPVGKNKLINPFTLNPLGTAVQVGQSAQSLSKIVAPQIFGKFDPHTMSSPWSLSNPLVQSFIDAASGPTGKPFSQRVEKNIALYNLYQGLVHPGSGSIFPGTRAEALGHFAIGSMYPRKYDPAAMKQALERMNINHPEALVPQQLTDYQKATGQQVPQDVTAGYLKDIKELQAQKNFKSDYAGQHNASSYRKLPPISQAQAALDYLKKTQHLPPTELQQYQDMIDHAQSDPEAKALASELWSVTGAGRYKTIWQQYMNEAKSTKLTKKK